ncbi:MAG TPA: hypothetical protein VG276_06515 [Actinomycetes bacterium]|nr:hypothetical protein [Actinomycetes bacterium]
MNDEDWQAGVVRHAGRHPPQPLGTEVFGCTQPVRTHHDDVGVLLIGGGLELIGGVPDAQRKRPR